MENDFRPGYPDNMTMLKSEPQDDGYETSGDVELRGQGEAPKLMGTHPNSNPLPHLPHAHQHQHSHPHQHQHQHQQSHPNQHPHLHSHQHQHPMQGGSLIKYEMQEDPYSFVDEEQMSNMASVHCPPVIIQQVPKKRGRKKKMKPEDQQQIQHG